MIAAGAATHCGRRTREGNRSPRGHVRRTGPQPLSTRGARAVELVRAGFAFLCAGRHSCSRHENPTPEAFSLVPRTMKRRYRALCPHGSNVAAQLQSAKSRGPYGLADRRKNDHPCCLFRARPRRRSPQPVRRKNFPGRASPASSRTLRSKFSRLPGPLLRAGPS